MKTAILFSILLLTGCGGFEFGGIKTPSPVYDPRIAVVAGATQEQSDQCVAESRPLQVSLGMGQMDNVRAGDHYEACVKRVGRK
jgi:hypothetical protein